MINSSAKRQNLILFLQGVPNSYAQVFFSTSKILAALLMVITFFDPVAGLSGLLAVLTANGLAWLMGYNHEKITAGYYGFNALLVGLGLGIYYQLTPEYLLVLLTATILTLFLTILMEAWLGKYYLPYLSIPFLAGIWMVILASRQFDALYVSERGLYMANEMVESGGFYLLGLYNWFESLQIPPMLKIYFKSLGAIFFQYHILAGMIIAIGILIYSRIAFLLSLFGFFSAYLFYLLVGGDITELSYSYIGFNYILTAIAIGGFFLIPSRHSFLWVLILTPLLSVAITSTSTFFTIFQLSVYSLPFNFVVLTFLFILRYREKNLRFPEMVSWQQFSPEKNLYSHRNAEERFMGYSYAEVTLPFWGEWIVTQGHQGDITHRDEWQHAWDFEIADETGSLYRNDGSRLQDYYCYDKPVISPVDGEIAEVVDHVEDNEVGDMNLEENWGNTIIIKYSETLYAKLSHLKKGTVKVAKGDSVKRGTLLAHCGNSGRSPRPHLHFQLQATPYIGSKTLDHPIAYYLLKKDNQFLLRLWDKPRENERVSNIEKNQNLYRAFHLIPGQELLFQIKNGEGLPETEKWLVKADIYNNTFLEAENSRARAWFRNDGRMFLFSHYEGPRNTLLFYFFLAAYRVPLGHYSGLQVTDRFPVHMLHRGPVKWLHDFIAPFHLILSGTFSLRFESQPDLLDEAPVRFSSKAIRTAAKRELKVFSFQTEIAKGRIAGFRIDLPGKSVYASEVETTGEK
ncbi:MAG: hypothetical protein Kow00127_18760 [Bacteroidales bacterium]